MYSSTLAALLRRTAFRFLKACENVEAQYPGASSKLPESDYTSLLAEEVRRLAEAENNDQQGDRQRPSPSQGSLEVKKE
jgi:hypothetical protein